MGYLNSLLSAATIAAALGTQRDRRHRRSSWRFDRRQHITERRDETGDAARCCVPGLANSNDDVVILNAVVLATG